MRIFVAIVLPETFRRDLMDATAELRKKRGDLRWIPADEMHLTLAFLGDLDASSLAIAEEAARKVSAIGRAFRMEADGLLSIPRRGSTRVLAAAMTAGGREAETLASSLEDELEVRGSGAGRPFRGRESRPFRAHVTLARSGRSPAVLTRQELAYPVRAASVIDTLAVYESRLDLKSNRYLPLAAFTLGGADVPGALPADRYGPDPGED